MTYEKKEITDQELRDYIRQNLPSMQELAPEEFKAMVKSGELMAEKLVTYMHGSISSREDRAVALVAFVAPEVTIEVGAVVVGIVAGEIAGAKAHAARRSELKQE